MGSAKAEYDEQILLKTLPQVVWKHVFQIIWFEFPTLDACSQASEYLDDLIKKNSHISISNGDTSHSFRCVPKSFGFTLFPDAFLPKPQLTALNICVSPTFEPANDYLEWLIESQRDSLESLRVSCLELKDKPFVLVLPGMKKLRVLRIERTMEWDEETGFSPSLTILEPPFLPALESLTLSAFGYDHWCDLLRRPYALSYREYSTCETVKHLRFLPSTSLYLRWIAKQIGGEFVLPHLVSLEIPAIPLDPVMYKMLPSLKRLTLTLPTEGLHEHLFDVAITGYGEQVCAAILATPDRDPQAIRAEIEEENGRHLDDFDDWERRRITADNELRREGRRLPNLTHFTGLEELSLTSDSGNWGWGPGVVSYSDLLNMKSLRTLRFSGFYPEYIPYEMMRKLKERFTVIITPNSDHAMDSSKIKNGPVRQNLLDVLPEAVWKQVLRHLISFQTLESCSEACDMFEDLIEKAGLLSVNRDKIVPGKFGNRISLHRGLTPMPRITTMNICVNSNFQPMDYYLNCLLKSQSGSLEILHISSLGIRSSPLKVDLPEMSKLWDLKLVRNVSWDTMRNSRWDGLTAAKKSMHYRKTAFLQALQSLTLSAFGSCESWKDFLKKPKGDENPEYPTCETVKFLRILPGRPRHVDFLMWNLTENFVFPNLVSLEIPAVLLDREMHDLFPAPETLKRLTLTLPTEGLHKHVFDVCITGYGEQVCAAILANPNRDPQEIRAEIEEENERQLDGDNQDWEKNRVIWDNFLRRQGRGWPNITGFLGLEELTLRSDTANWGPTVVSCADLLNMKSLKSLRFCGFYPKYIPNDTMDDLKERFTVAWD